jgi:uncharacterized protein YdiU (UPF0061 family)
MYKSIKSLPKVNYLQSELKEIIHYKKTVPTRPSSPKLLSLNKILMKELHIHDSSEEELLDVLSGREQLPSWSLCYGGHQFKQWAGQLGDGRAHSIGQFIENETIYEIQLKGSGKTPYSRFGDGLAVLRSSIREYLCSEAMHFLNVPTSRSLSLISTGDIVQREELEPGAIVSRVLDSWIRFGSFEILYAREQIDELEQLVDYCIRHFFKDINETLNRDEKYLKFIEKAVSRTAEMIGHWQAVGFCHGVMNTDNFSIIGATIDYGPFQFLDEYDPYYICNHSDEMGIYSFAQQPEVGHWNIVRLVNSLTPLLSKVSMDQLVPILKSYRITLYETYNRLMSKKLGFIDPPKEFLNEILQPLLELMANGRFDYNEFFKRFTLFDIQGNEELTMANFEELLETSYLDGFYQEKDADGNFLFSNWQKWYKKYREYFIMDRISLDSRRDVMRASNPNFILRNHIVDMVIKEAESGNTSLIDKYLKVLQSPFIQGSDEERLLFGGIVPKDKLNMKCSCSS